MVVQKCDTTQHTHTLYFNDNKKIAVILNGMLWNKLSQKLAIGATALQETIEMCKKPK